MERNILTVSFSGVVQLCFACSLLLSSCATHSYHITFTDEAWQYDNKTGIATEKGSELQLSLAVQEGKSAELTVDKEASFYTATHLPDKSYRQWIGSVMKDIGGGNNLIRFIADESICLFSPDESWFDNLKPDLINNMGAQVQTNHLSDIYQTSAQQRQTANEIWRNVVNNPQKQRVIIIDRFVKAGTKLAIAYILQTESSKCSYGHMIFDISHPSSSVFIPFDQYWKLSEQMLKGQTPFVTDAQQHFNQLIWQADSAYMNRDYKLADRLYEQALMMGTYVRAKDWYNGACCAALSGNKDKAFERLFHRLEMDQQWGTQSTHLEHDLDLSSLHGDARWMRLLEVLRERGGVVGSSSSERITNLSLYKQLEEIMRRDQNIRQKYTSLINGNGDSLEIETTVKEMGRIDKQNEEEICHLLDTQGWAGRQEVGNASQVYWLVLQHSDLATHKRYLPLVQKAADAGDITKEQLAMYEDRISVSEGKPQKYGTQVSRDANGRYTVENLLDPDRVDEWRKQMGLCPLKQYVEQMNNE